MRIGIDARELAGHVTGVGRYLRGLLHEWSTGQSAEQHEFILYAHDVPNAPVDSRRIRYRHVNGPPGTWWEQVRLPPVATKDHLDVFFAPAYTRPLLLDVPTVVTIHDLSYAAHPEWFRVREGMRRRWLTRRSAAGAQAVITVSEFSKGEIVERLGIKPEGVHVIPQGITVPSSPSGATAPRVLYVGSIFNRRHVPDLVRAVHMLSRTHPDVSLDIVGDNRTFPHEDLAGLIENGEVEPRVRWHRYATDDQLGQLYGQARAFAFLSEYEGLGTTPLEALAAAIPPVVADTKVARETYDRAALYVPVGDVSLAARALESALFDEATRASILGARRETLARFDWPRAARETLAVLEASQ